MPQESQGTQKNISHDTLNLIIENKLKKAGDAKTNSKIVLELFSNPDYLDEFIELRHKIICEVLKEFEVEVPEDLKSSLECLINIMEEGEIKSLRTIAQERTNG